MRAVFTFILYFLVSVPQAYAEPNMVLCWIFGMQGCPGVELQSGNAISMRNNGTSGIGAIGGATSRVETRTIINVPDYRIRRFLRSLGLGGQRINISFENDGVDCLHTQENLSLSNNSLFQTSDAHECLRGMQEDLINLPNGLNLQVLRCQEHFCNTDFIEMFEAFLLDHPQFRVSDLSQFLGCGQSSIEI